MHQIYVYIQTTSSKPIKLQTYTVETIYANMVI